MSSIIKKRRGGSTYLYAATSARVDGRPRIVEQVYLGTEALRGVRYSPKGARTESIVMRSRSGTIRSVQSNHSLDKVAQHS